METHTASDRSVLRVIIVEDNVDDAIIVEHRLATAGYTVRARRVDDLDDFERALGEPFDLVISDYHLGAFTALDVLERFRRAERSEPFVIVSGAMGEEVGVEAMRAGAQDYIFKGNLSRLAPAVERELREARERAGRRRDREALFAKTRILKSVMESLVDALVVVDAKGEVTLFNPAAERLFGPLQRGVGFENWARSREVFLSDGVTPVPETSTPRLRTVRGEEVRGEEYLVKNSSGSDGVWVSCNGTPLRDETGGVVGGVLLSRDITARKRAEEALRRSEEKFLQAQKMEAVGRLAGGVAHDFNNVLSVVGNYAALTLRGLGEDERLRGYVEEIAAASRRAGELTRQLLTFSRRHATQVTAVDLNGVIVGVEAMLGSLVGEDIELVLRLGAKVPLVRGVAVQFEQVLLNFVANARDAMPNGGTIEIETSVSAGRVLLRVSDTGLGMPLEVAAHVFEPFFTTKGPGHGTGLGLATVYGIVTGCGGDVSVSSTPGHGAVFTVSLPACADETTAGVLSPVAAVTARAGRETVLVVEDDDAVRALTVELLTRHGYRALDARGAGEALLLAERHTGPIDVVLSDVVMPHMGGPELIERLRVLRPAVRVVFMSGYTDGPVGGGQEVLVTKPFGVDELVGAVRGVLDGEK